MHDLIIRGGTLIDGTGAPARQADVAISGGIIIAVGRDLGSGREEIDATRLLVTPGWATSLSGGRVRAHRNPNGRAP